MSEAETVAGSDVRSGGCLCGKVRFTVTGPVDDPHICACEHCARRSGSPFQWWAGFLMPGLEWTGAEPTWYDTHPGKTARGFCPDCVMQALRVSNPEVSRLKGGRRLHNALDIAEIFRQLLDEGWEIDPEDLALISPYLTEHINRFGEDSTHELGNQPDAYDPKLDVDFTPLREQDLTAAGLGQVA
ncbi:GFA family protein [Streptomyces parvus]